MVRPTFTTALAVAALAGSALAQSNAKGTRDKPCPADSPCCGLYGDCGIGAFCLGGCDITMSHSIKSCVPNPICKSGDYKMNSLDDVQDISKYLGDNSKINWQSQGKPLKYKDENLLLTMYEDSDGSLLASTFYVWYGKICARMTSSQGKGVVTAFIMMSDVKDEIDFEWIGADISTVQSNYYSQGAIDYTKTKNLTVDDSTKWHDYCIDWKPEELKWSVDGKEVRTVKKSDTWNSTDNRFAYPQTPSRIMISLWPAGKKTNAKGTIDWAGGEIDWHSKYMLSGGYYAAGLSSVSVQCYDPPAGAKKNGDKSYKYTDKAATNNTIEISNDIVVLGSLDGSGENPGEASKTQSSSQSTKTALQVPGAIIGGAHQDQPTGSAGSGSSGNNGQSGSGNNNGGTAGGEFVQGINSPASNSFGVSVEPGLGKVGGSALAIVVAILGLIAL